MVAAAASDMEYFKTHPAPHTPCDLKDHACIGFPLKGSIYRWEFERGRKAPTVDAQGPLVLDDPHLVVQAALRGVGLGIGTEDAGAEFIGRGKVVQVLDDWCKPFPGFFFTIRAGAISLRRWLL